MCDFFDGETYEPEVNTTPNIEFQINKFDEDEPLYQKCISVQNLFATSDFIIKIKSLYENNIDLPILVYGVQGIGKLTSIICLLQYLPSYLSEILDTTQKLNNIHYFKILDTEFNKIFFYENVYYLNIEILNNNNEIINYLKYIYKIAKSSNINIFNTNDDVLKPIEKKIIIITHINKCNDESLKYISYMLDKMNGYISYIFTTDSIKSIDKKMLSLCTPIHYKYLDESSFIKIFKYNYKKIFAKDSHNLTLPIIRQFYQIYISNNYNLGNTISQIKYHLDADGVLFLKDKTNKCSLLSKIATNFIKKKLILANVSSALEIRRFLYILLSLNIKLSIFIKEVVKQLINNNSHQNLHIKMNNAKKTMIIEKASYLTADINKANKEIIIGEAFFYDIINILYDDLII